MMFQKSVSVHCTVRFVFLRPLFPTCFHREIPCRSLPPPCDIKRNRPNQASENDSYEVLQFLKWHSANWKRFTPLKTNIKREIDGFQEGISFSRVPPFFRFLCFSFGGVLFMEMFGVQVVSGIFWTHRITPCWNVLKVPTRHRSLPCRWQKVPPWSEILGSDATTTAWFLMQKWKNQKVPTGTIWLRHHAIFSHHIMHLESRPPKIPAFCEVSIVFW